MAFNTTKANSWLLISTMTNAEIDMGVKCLNAYVCMVPSMVHDPLKVTIPRNTPNDKVP